MSFYTLNQNNSGGYFMEDEDAGICGCVIIEAATLDGFHLRARSILRDFREFCDCCGDRWPDGWTDEDDATETPEIYGEPVISVKKGMFRDSVYIHYLGGRIEKIELKEAEQ